MTQLLPDLPEASKAGLPPEGDLTRPGPRRTWRWLALALLLAASAAIFYTLRRYIHADVVLAHYGQIQDAVSRSRILAVLGYMTAYFTAVCLSVPGAIMMTAMGGLLFGWLVGGIAATLAAGTGAVVVFVFARSTFGPMFLRDAGPRMARIAAGLQEDAANFLLFLRLTPVVPFFVINVAAALFGVRLSTFAWCTYLGILPAAFAIAGAGSALDGVLMAQKAALEACRATGRLDCSVDFSFKTLLTPGLLAALAGLGILALLPAVLRHLGVTGKSRRTTP